MGEVDWTALMKRERAASGLTYGLVVCLISVVQSVTAMAADPCAGTPTVGTVCADGTIYAGISPDGDEPMFATRCDAGQSWDGSACSGTRQLLSFNNWDPNNDGTTDDSDATYVLGTSEGQSDTAGEANTAYHAGRSDAGAPYYAAQYCQDLTQHGHSDWYLPARDELNLLYQGHDQIDGLYRGTTCCSDLGGKDVAAGRYGRNNYIERYWSSTEHAGSRHDAWSQYFNDGNQSSSFEYRGFAVRCVRK